MSGEPKLYVLKTTIDYGHEYYLIWRADSFFADDDDSAKKRAAILRKNHHKSRYEGHTSLLLEISEHEKPRLVERACWENASPAVPARAAVKAGFRFFTK